MSQCKSAQNLKLYAILFNHVDLMFSIRIGSRGCNSCTSTSYCTSCNTGYMLSWGLCNAIFEMSGMVSLSTLPVVGATVTVTVGSHSISAITGLTGVYIIPHLQSNGQLLTVTVTQSSHVLYSTSVIAPSVPGAVTKNFRMFIIFDAIFETKFVSLIYSIISISRHHS